MKTVVGFEIDFIGQCLCASHAGDAEHPETAIPKETLAVMQAIYGKSSQKKPLTSFQWGLAFDVFAIAAAATGMLPYAVALTHKLVCTKVGHEARGRGIKANLGVVYDEVA